MWRGRLQPTLWGPERLSRKLAHLQLYWSLMSIAKAVYCYIFDLQAQNSDHQHNFMQFRDAFNRKSVRLTLTYTIICEEPPILWTQWPSVRYIIKGRILSKQKLKKKTCSAQWGKKAGMAMRKNDSRPHSTGRSSILAPVDSHGGKDAVAFLLKIILLKEQTVDKRINQGVLTHWEMVDLDL